MGFKAAFLKLRIEHTFGLIDVDDCSCGISQICPRKYMGSVFNGLFFYTHSEFVFELDRCSANGRDERKGKIK